MNDPSVDRDRPSAVSLPQRLTPVSASRPGLGLFVRLMAGNGGRREQRARLSALMALAARGSTLLTLLVLIPASRSELGPERFGLWMLLCSLPVALGFVDFGIGNGIMNAVAAASGRDDRTEMRRIVSNGFMLLMIAAAALMLVFAAIAGSVDWGKVFNVHERLAVTEASQSAWVVAACIALAVATALTSKVQTGLQEGVLAHGLIAAGNVVSFIAVLSAVKFGYGVPVMLALLLGLPALIQVAASLFYFSKVHPDLRPRLADVDPVLLQTLVSAGVLFFVMQLCYVVNSRFDAFLVAHYGSSADAGLYLTLDRVFAIATVLPIAFLAPLWPAYAEAKSRHDLEWIRKTFRVATLKAAGLTGAASLAIVALQRPLGHWLPIADASWGIVLGFVVWKVVEAVVYSGSMLITGGGMLKSSMAMLAGSAMLSIIVKLALVPTLGPLAIVWLTAAISLICSGLPLIVLVPRLYRIIALERTNQQSDRHGRGRRAAT